MDRTKQLGACNAARQLWPTLVILGLAVLVGRGAAQPAASDPSFETIKKDYDNAWQKYMDELRKKLQAEQDAAQAELKAAKKAVADAKTDDEKLAANKRLKKASSFPATMAISMADGPGAAFSKRFLDFAVKHPKNPAVLDAFNMALTTSGGPGGNSGTKSGIVGALGGNGETWGAIVKALQADQVKNPELVKWVRLFRQLANAHDVASDQFLRDVMAKNPDRKAQGRACVALCRAKPAPPSWASASRLTRVSAATPRNSWEAKTP